jgi:HSP20 family protein
MLTYWNDLPLLDLDRVFDDVMRSSFAAGTGTSASHPSHPSQTFQPAIDVRSDDDKIVFECDVPGLKHEDLEVTLDNHVLTIKGARKLETASDTQRVLLGRAYGSFSSVYTLPEGVDAEHMTAELSSGVLTVTVPKLAQAKPRRIAIGGGREAKELNK